MALSFGPRRATYFEIAAPARQRRAALGRRPRPLREARPDLPVAVRPPLQLRAHVRPSGRLHLVGALRRGHPLRLGRLRPRRPRPRRRRHRLLRGRPQGDGPLRAVGPARRDRRASADRPAALLPADDRHRLRLEDLLGFRRNPITDTPLFRAFGARALDGHPTPATPFVRLSTGASGVGMASSIGLAFGARDYYGADAPRVHIVEGEGGLTPGRVGEALAAAGTASLGNVLVHLDWNQASIDSEKVCRDGSVPGDYVQWDPRELFYLHDWNVICVADGFDFQQVVAAQRRALEIDNGQPTAIVYRTIKGWRYGVEGKASHGAGHKLCSEGFYEAVAELTEAGAAIAAHLRAGRPALPAGRARRRRPRGVLLGGARGRAGRHRREPSRPRRRSPPGCAPPANGSTHGLAARARTRRASTPCTRPRPRAPRGSRTSCASRPARPPRCAASSAAASATSTRPPAAPLLAAAADLLGSTSLSAAGDGFPPRVLERTGQPRLAPARHRRHLRGRHGRHPLRHLRLRPRPRRWLLLRRLPGAARAHRGATARHRRTGPARGIRRAIQARSSWCAAMPASRPARTGRRTPTRRRCSSCSRTSRWARRSR